MGESALVSILATLRRVEAEAEAGLVYAGIRFDTSNVVRLNSAVAVVTMMSRSQDAAAISSCTNGYFLLLMHPQRGTEVLKVSSARQLLLNSYRFFFEFPSPALQRADHFLQSGWDSMVFSTWMDCLQMLS